MAILTGDYQPANLVQFSGTQCSDKNASIFRKLFVANRLTTQSKRCFRIDILRTLAISDPQLGRNGDKMLNKTPKEHGLLMVNLRCRKNSCLAVQCILPWKRLKYTNLLYLTKVDPVLKRRFNEIQSNIYVYIIQPITLSLVKRTTETIWEQKNKALSKSCETSWAQGSMFQRFRADSWGEQG